jgi:adenine-specific DNA methylase
MQNLMFGDMADIGPILADLRKLPMNYVGNKRKIMGNIWTIIEKEKIEFDSIIDLFSGSGVVSYFMKRLGKRVIANDLLTSSYLKSLTLIENPGVQLTKEEMQFLIHHDNPNKSDFVRARYADKYFTQKESLFLDNYRANVEELVCGHKQSLGMVSNNAVCLRLPWGGIDKAKDLYKHRRRQMRDYGKDSGNYDRRIGIYWDDNMDLKFDKWIAKYIDDYEEAVIAGLQKSMQYKQGSALDGMNGNILQNCFLGGRLYSGQTLAKLNHRLNHAKHQQQEMQDKKVFEMLSVNNKCCVPTESTCIALNWDAVELMSTGLIDVDIAYIDPPYGGNSSDYSYMYQFVEEYVYSKPIDELEHISSFGKKFAKSKNYDQHFVDLISSCKNIPILIISYNDSSWSDIESITESIESLGRSVTTYEISGYVYNYRKDKNKKKGTEFLIICR